MEEDKKFEGHKSLKDTSFVSYTNIIEAISIPDSKAYMIYNAIQDVVKELFDAYDERTIPSSVLRAGVTECVTGAVSTAYSKSGPATKAKVTYFFCIYLFREYKTAQKELKSQQEELANALS